MPAVPSTILQFASRFATEEDCAKYLLSLRWPKGFVCPRCGTKGGYRIAKRSTIECTSRLCRYQSSLTAGTILHGSRQDLRKWFWAVFFVATITPGISASQLQRLLGLRRYETAYQMLQKLRAALVPPDRKPLQREVEIDETYVGGEEEGRPGRGAGTKALVVCAVELVHWKDKHTGKRRTRARRVRLRVVPDASARSLVPFVQDNVAPGAIVRTDGWQGYASLKKHGYKHRPRTQGAGDSAKYMPHVHLMISNVKTWLLGTHHGRVSEKHLQAYLNEFTFRFNRRYWRGSAINRALNLIFQAGRAPTYEQVYGCGEDGAWRHPGSHSYSSEEARQEKSFPE